MPWKEPARLGVKLTYDDYVLIPDDGKRHELIDGVHYVTASPNSRHQQISGDLQGFLWVYLQANPIGRVFAAPLDVVLTHFDVVEPDLLYMSDATAARVITRENVRGTPDLVVEVVSPGTRKRDATSKRQLYERSGVAEYWVVDPDVNVVRIFRREDGRFTRGVELRRDAGDTLTTPLLPGFAVPLARLLRD